MPSFEIVQAGLYDDLVQDAQGHVLDTVAMSLPFTVGQAKKLLFVIQTAPGTYAVAVEIHRPDTTSVRHALGQVTVDESGKHIIIFNWHITEPLASGWWHMRLIIGGTSKRALSAQF